MRVPAGWIGLVPFTVLVFGRCALTQTTTRASVDSSGAQAHGPSTKPSISADGRLVAFASTASDLVSGDTNGYSDIFVHDLQAGTTERVSLGFTGVESDADSFSPSISSDGRYVAFDSFATNLVPGDTNGHSDVFVHDRQTGTTALASTDSNGFQSNDDCFFPVLSLTGRYVAFESRAGNLVVGDTNGLFDVFVHDLQAGSTACASVDSAGVLGNNASFAPSLSSDARYVAFHSYSSNLVVNDTNSFVDVFVHDFQTGATIRVSVSSSGAQADLSSWAPAMSSDGRYVAFGSYADNLVPGDSNGVLDVFVHDLQTGATTRVSVDSFGNQGNQASLLPSISSGGRYVAFESFANNLVLGDNNGSWDVFVHDRWSTTTTRASVSSSGLPGNLDSDDGSISADGRFVAFQSDASNLVSGDNNGCTDIFVRDRGAASAFVAFCPGDGSGTPCPCGNSGVTGHGCDNSSATGGALLTVTGAASLSADTVQFTSSSEKPTPVSIVLQGTASTSPINFGDGLRCTGGNLKRLYAKIALNGVVTAPQSGDPTVSARSAALGDPISLGATRCYQVYYRDSSATFCPAPLGSTFNVSNAIAIAWGF